MNRRSLAYSESALESGSWEVSIVPITGSRASEHCETCVRDRTECGNCKYLSHDRRQEERRRTDESDNFMGAGAVSGEYIADSRQAS